MRVLFRASVAEQPPQKLTAEADAVAIGSGIQGGWKWGPRRSFEHELSLRPLGFGGIVDGVANLKKVDVQKYTNVDKLIGKTFGQIADKAVHSRSRKIRLGIYGGGNQRAVTFRWGGIGRWSLLHLVASGLLSDVGGRPGDGALCGGKFFLGFYVFERTLTLIDQSHERVSGVEVRLAFGGKEYLMETSFNFEDSVLSVKSEHNGPEPVWEDHGHQQQAAQSMSFQPSSGPSSSSQSSSGQLSPISSLQNQLTMNMLNNMMQIQSAGDQLMSGQQTQGGGASNMQYNNQAMFVEQQFKLNQLQQLQQLQNQIFQQQPFLSTSPPLNRPDILSNGLPLSAMKDQGSSSSSSHNGPVSLYTGLPTPAERLGPSSELRPRDSSMDFVSPMILNTNSYLDSPISPQSTHNPNDQSFSHSHQQAVSHTHPQPYHTHAHTAPPQIAFHIQSTISSNPTSPVFSGADVPPSSTLSVMSGPRTELDLDISPLTSPWLGAAGNQHQHGHHHQRHQSQTGVDSGLGLHHSRSASFSHHTGASSSLRSKRPAGGNSGNDLDDHSVPPNNAFESSEPLRKKHPMNSPAAMRGLNHPPQSHHHLTPLAPLSQSSNSPIASPTSPLSAGLNSASTVTGAGNSTASSSSSTPSGPGTSTQRRTYRGSKSVSNTPLLRGQRSRIGSVTRGQGNANANSSSGAMGVGLPQHAMNSAGNTSATNTPSTSGIGTGMSMMGVAVGDTPSPVDLDMSMPPPAPPEHSGNGNGNGTSSNSNSGSGSGSGVGSSPNLAPDNGMNINVGGMGFGTMGMGEGTLLPVTPASIMKLGRLGAGAGAGAGAGGPGASNLAHGHVPVLRTPRLPQQQSSNLLESTGSTGKDKRAEKERGEKAGEKGKEGNAKGKAATSIATGRTRRSTATTAAAAGGTGVSPGLKTILPANALDSTSSAPHNTSTSRNEQNQAQAPRKTSHKAAEQKRRDALKSTFDDLRTLLPPIPLPSEVDDGVGGSTGDGIIPGIPGAWPPRSSSQLPGSLPPRGPPKTGAEGPNKGVSKLQLLICGNEYIRVLRARVERRDDEIGRLREEVGKLRSLVRDLKLTGDEGKDGDVEMMDDAGVGFDLDLDLERDLDAVELHGGGLGIGAGVAGVGAGMGVLGSVGEQPELEEDDGD
ncbi:hypothetical protein P691DRAFT_790295 [Macrolepiota fuliginosa MF-IS2]|uniref:BHLH domain-containing protein n=1 Tax=Macrolepiota fuliginosa MF-IS2 TaxID=1400762 RepID=A0A9P5XFN6_9AGAR|nr:hypothetical protein P691DRAFT_790295 [Macrolepiota fuliginosa MF-IS2]